MIPYAIQLAPQINATSEPPLNITLGRDINGDSLFLERPAFATDLTRPSVRLTRFGDSDTDPLPGQTIIPRNYGRAYPNLSVNLRVTRAWGFGERSTAQGGRGRHYTLTASVQARNLINTVNPGSPSGDLSSPLFGVPTNIQGGSNANRRIETQVKFEF